MKKNFYKYSLRVPYLFLINFSLDSLGLFFLNLSSYSFWKLFFYYALYMTADFHLNMNRKFIGFRV